MTSDHTIGPLAIVLAVALSMGSIATGGTRADVDRDEALARAVEAEDLALSETLLDTGADPNAEIGGYPGDAPLCRATAPGRSDLLDLLLERGGDVNRWYAAGGDFYRTPFVCAISKGGLAAFERLIDEGAETDLSLCGGCVPEFDTTPFEVAAYSMRYAMIWRLVELRDLSDRETETLIHVIENSVPLTDVELFHPDRVKLIAWLRERGFDIVPKERHAIIERRG